VLDNSSIPVFYPFPVSGHKPLQKLETITTGQKITIKKLLEGAGTSATYWCSVFKNK